MGKADRVKGKVKHIFRLDPRPLNFQNQKTLDNSDLDILIYRINKG